MGEPEVRERKSCGWLILNALWTGWPGEPRYMDTFDSQRETPAVAQDQAQNLGYLLSHVGKWKVSPDFFTANSCHRKSPTVLSESSYAPASTVNINMILSTMSSRFFNIAKRLLNITAAEKKTQHPENKLCFDESEPFFSGLFFPRAALNSTASVNLLDVYCRVRARQ